MTGSQWLWNPPAGWPLSPSLQIPGAEFWPDFDRWPPASQEHRWFTLAPGAFAKPKLDGIPISVDLFDTPPTQPISPPLRWIPAPGWPEPQRGWAPPAGWKPTGLPRAPRDWNFWQPDWRPWRDEVARWHQQKNEAATQALAFTQGQAGWLDGAERLLNLVRAGLQVHRHPVGILAAMLGGDVAPPVRVAQNAAYHRALAACLDFRQRSIAVADGRWSVEQAHLIQSSVVAVEASRAASGVSLDITVDFATRISEGSTRPRRPLCTPAQAEAVIAQGVDEHNARDEWAHRWAFGRGSGRSSAGQGGSWQDAEEAAASHMRHRLGFGDARVTPPGADNGIDVRSAQALAQVKNYAKPVGQPDIQRLVGACEGRGLPIFYALSGFSAKATEYANRAGVALFRYDAPGDPVAVNRHAERLLRR